MKTFRDFVSDSVGESGNNIDLRQNASKTKLS